MPSAEAPSPAQKKGLASRLIDNAYIGFYALFFVSLALVDWRGLGVVGALATILIASFIADFLSGVWHLYIDYRPLNYAGGVDKVYFYRGDRGSPEFMQLSRETFSKLPRFDNYIYTFKIHHLAPNAVAKYNFNQRFLDTSLPAFVLVLAACCGIGLLGPAFPPEIALALIVMGGLVANIEFIHACVHKSPRFPIGRKIIRGLQWLRLIYPTETHTRHHRGDGVGFCFLTGHSNWLVDLICKHLVRRGLILDDHWHGKP